MGKPIRKLLIANRGEIVIRIIRACRDLGIKTVAVYSDADREAPYVREADEAYHIGSSAPPRSYLNIATIIGAAKKSGADAIHPGYGFLAEIADFAEAVVSNGIIWVGPPSQVMAKIESKCYCRKLAQSVGVPVIPGTLEPIQTADQIREYLMNTKHDGPLFLKLDKGGGGKGIEEISKPEEVEPIFQKIKSIGKLAFNNSDCYIEHRIDKPRHIEIQVIGDDYGNFISLGERECSIQRRHQKIIEECPSPVVDEATREELSQLALRLARAMGYKNGGSLEFLRSKDGNFYFMEINARLQVEHPITEMVTGMDLVKLQLKVASGEKIGIHQEDVKFRGHAIEARVYAEHPVTFIPSPGKIKTLSLPQVREDVRIDHALGQGIAIPPYYDPLIAKLIVWGETRGAAIQKMKDALAQFKIEGIETTIPLNQQIMEKEEFGQGILSTRFLDEFLHIGTG